MDGSKKKIDNILGLTDHDRYLYFVRKVADMEEVWGLYDDGWALLGDKNGLEVVPFWPEEAFAQLCGIDQWKGYRPKSIRLDDFLQKWLPGMEGDGRHLNVFYTNLSRGLIKSPGKLAADLQNGLNDLE